MSFKIKSFGFKVKGEGRKVLAVFDWENLFANLSLPPAEKFSMAAGFDRLIREISDKVGEIVNVFIFTPPHLISSMGQDFYEQGFFIIACPKVKNKAGEITDTTDATLIRFGERQMDQIDGLTHLCLGSGDRDFTPLIRRARQKGLRVVVTAGSERSLASEMIKLADQIFVFSPSNE